MRSIVHDRLWGLGKNGIQKPNPNLKEIELSFLHHSIHLKKQLFVKKKVEIGWKVVNLCPLKIWNFGLIFWDMNLKFVLLIIYINIDGQTNCEVNKT